MKKKVLCIAIFLVIFVGLTACGEKTCKVNGCGESEIYEDGYCRYHYYENVGSNFLKDLINYS